MFSLPEAGGEVAVDVEGRSGGCRGDGGRAGGGLGEVCWSHWWGVDGNVVVGVWCEWP